MPVRLCTITDCVKPYHSRGWCAMHYARARAHGGDPLAIVERRASGSMEERLRFYGWTVAPSGCWEYAGGRDPLGYGYIRDPQLDRMTGTHRAAYRVWVGPIPSGMEVRHRCDNPPCINPAHLEIGTHAQNVNDAKVRDRVSFGSRHYNAVLIEPEIPEILAALKRGETQTSLALVYGVHQSTISRIKAGKRWRRAVEKVA